MDTVTKGGRYLADGHGGIEFFVTPRTPFQSGAPIQRDWAWKNSPPCSRRCTSGPRSELPDEDPGRDFADRALKLATTFRGAGVIHGDLTPECAEMVGRVLDVLSVQPTSAAAQPGETGQP